MTMPRIICHQHALHSMLLACPLLLAACSDDASSTKPNPGPGKLPAPHTQVVLAAIGAAGGELVHPGGAALSVPAGALAAEVTLSLQGAAPPTSSASGGHAAGNAVVAGPAGQAFALPVELCLPVDLAALPAGASSTYLRLATAAAGSDDFVAVDSTYHAAAGVVCAQVAHFSTFVPIAPLTTTPMFITTATTLPAGALGAAYAELLLAASGGAAPYAWAVTAGALPAGLTLSGSGAISGTPSAAGTFAMTVRVTDSAGQKLEKPLLLTVSAPSGGAPSVVAVTPKALEQGAGDTTLAIEGAAMVPQSLVLWDDAPLKTTYHSASYLQAVVPAALLAAAGAHTLKVVNPPPGGGASAPWPIQVEAKALLPVPVLTELDPTTLAVGAPDSQITVYGKDFVASSQVLIGPQALATQAVSATQLLAVVPASYLKAPGTLQVQVFTPAPGGGLSAAKAIVVGGQTGTPTLATLTPASAIAGSGDLLVQLEGSGFATGAKAYLGSTALATTVSDASHAEALLPADVLAAVATYAITLVNPSPGGGSSGALTFAVKAAELPDAVDGGGLDAAGQDGTAQDGVAQDGTAQDGVVGDGGADVSDSGADGVDAAPDAVDVDDGTVDAGSDAVDGDDGAADDGSDAADAGLDVGDVDFSAPAIAGMDPSSAGQWSPTIAGAHLFGSGFAPGCKVKVIDQELTYTYNSPTSLTVTIPAALLLKAGTLPIQVANPAPGGTSLPFGFKVLAGTPVQATVSALVPPSLPVDAAELTLAVHGTNFHGGSVVYADASPLVTTWQSPTLLHAVLPANAHPQVGALGIAVHNPDAAASAPTTLAVTAAGNPLPWLAPLAATDASAVVGSSDKTITVKGANFLATSVARLQGTAVATQVASATALTVTLPKALLATAGTRTLDVVNPAPGGGASNGVPFTVEAANPVPTLNAIMPSEVKGYSWDLPVVLKSTEGTFVPGAVARADGTDVATTFLSKSELLAIVPGTLLKKKTGTLTLTVFHPAPAGGASSGQVLKIVSGGNDIPGTTCSSPTTANQVQPGQGSTITYTVCGSYLMPTTEVWFGTTKIYKPTWNATKKTLSFPISAIYQQTAGTVPIYVVNPPPGGGASTASFTVKGSNPVPDISALSPDKLGVGTGDYIVSMTVTGWLPYTTEVSASAGSKTISLGKCQDIGTVAGVTKCSLKLPAALFAQTGTVSLSAANPAPGGGKGKVATLAVEPGLPTPTVTGQSIYKAKVGLSGQEVVISGSGFTAQTEVKAADGSKLAVKAWTATTLTAILADAMVASEGTVTILSVANPPQGVPPSGGGVAAKTVVITCYQPPQLTALDPATVKVGAGSVTLKLVGKGLAPTAEFYGQVKFGSKAVMPLTKDATAWTVQVPEEFLLVPVKVPVKVSLEGWGESNELIFETTP